MPDIYPSPEFSDLPMKSPLLDLPRLGGVRNYAALRALRSIHQFEWLTKSEPTLHLSREQVFRENTHFDHAWRQAIGSNALLVFPDCSCLIFRESTAGSLEALPFVFKIPKAVPFLKFQDFEGESNMIFDIRGSSDLQFGISPQRQLKPFADIRAPANAPTDMGQLLIGAMTSLEVEVAGWISALQDYSLHEDPATPVALSLIWENTDKISLLRSWLCKVVSYGSECLAAHGNPLSVSIFDPGFSQMDGSPELSFEVKTDGAIADELDRDFSSNLLDAVPQLISDGKAPVQLKDLFRRVSFRDTRRHLASDISDMDFHVEAFARVSLSHHERLVLETQFGFRSIVEKHAVK